jgi:hypothetical protein
MQVNCYSKGVEVVPARVEYCMDFNFEIETLKKKELLELIQNEKEKKESPEDENKDEEQKTQASAAQF